MRLPNGRSPILLVAIVGLLAAAAAIPALGATAKVGGSCTKKQVGKTSGTLVCVKSGSKYAWAKRSTSSTSKTPSSSGSSTSSGSGSAASTQIDVAAIAFGTVPTAATSKLDVACNGLSGSQSQAVATVNFGAQGGTNRVPFALVAPSSNNPTGSLCTASATAPGAVNIRFLINGLPDGSVSSGATATSRAFTGADAVVTLLIEYTAGSAPATIAPGTAVALTTTTVAGATTTAAATATTIAGATTTTIGAPTPPPASGRPELATRFLTAIPTGMTGVDFTTNCTPPTSPGSFQTQAVRLGNLPSTAQLTLTLTPGSGTVAATACQVEARLLGTGVGGAGLRFLLNGQPMAGATTGSFINSPTFMAPQPFTVTLEVSFPGLASSPTTTTLAGATTTTTIAGATTTTLTGAPTTTIAGAANQAIVSLNVTRTGTAPANLDGYFIDLACSSVLVGTNPNGAFSFRSRILPAGGTSSVPVTINAGSTCSVTVTSIASTGSITTGTVSVASGGVPRASGAGGAASTSPFPIVAGSQTVAIAIGY